MAEVFQLDLDEELISHMAIPESVSLIWGEDLSSELIEDDLARNIFNWQFSHLREHGKPASASVLAEEFDLDFQEPLTAVGDLVDRLRERYMRNNARSHMERLASVYKENPAAVPRFMLDQGRELSAIVDRKGDQFGTGDYTRAMQRYDEQVLRGDRGSFGFEEVDHHFHGLRGVTFVVAAPKTYKSWLMVNSLAENVMQGKCCWLYPLEMPADETDMRLRCLVSGVPYWKYIRNAIGPQERTQLSEGSELLDGMGVYRIVKPPVGKRVMEDMVERARDAGADLVYVDQLQYVETRTGKQLGAGDHKDYWQPLEAARELSEAGPIVIAHQFNRTVMFADKMPEMQQAKGAAAVEETATLVLGLWANRDMRQSHVVELGTLASRNYMYQSWEIGVDLTYDCSFSMIGVAEHE